jgi:hemolysin III
MPEPPVASAPRYRFGDELASTLIHALGIVLSIAGLAVLVAFAALHGDARAVLACAVFGSTLILLYTASTLYHAIPGELPRRVLRTLDHIAIFLLIAGTYTPFTLIALPGAWGWSLFGLIWALAMAGSALVLGLLRRLRTRWLAVAIYVAMGWVALVAFQPLHAHLAPGGLALLIAGGATYTLGVPFYLCKRVPFHHAVWHGFVLAGSVLHYLAVLLYVIPE